MSDETPDSLLDLDGGRRGPAGWRPSRRQLLGGAAGGGVLGAALAGLGDLGEALDARTDDSAPEPAVESDVGAHEAVLSLVRRSDVTHRAVRSGDWADERIWADGQLPGDSARVLIEDGVTVTVDHRDSERLKTLRVDGGLRFAPDTDTELRVETLVTAPESVLEIGSADQPIEPGSTATLTFVDHGPIDEEWDPTRVSKGLLAMGAVRMHGAETSSWHALASAPTPGTDTLELDTEPTGWQAGDRIVFPGVDPETNEDERAVVTAVAGRTVTLDRQLRHDHRPPRSDLDSYVLNLDRNVRLESERADIPRRGHTMFMSQSVDINYAGFYDLGRTDKSYAHTNPDHGPPPEDVPPNPKARYGLHFHETGIDAPSPNIVTGCVVWGSPGWGIVNHHSHVDVTDSITYEVLGAGFVAEAGTERGSFTGNFALRSTGSGDLLDSREFDSVSQLEPGDVDDFGHGGHGFWFQGPAVTVEDNVAAGHRYYAYVYWNRPLIDRELEPDEQIRRTHGTVANFPLEYVDGQAPLKESSHVSDGKVSSAYVHLDSFKGNTAFASAGGLDFSRHMFGWSHTRIEEYSTIEDFTAYNIGSFTTGWGETVEPDYRNRRGGNSAITIRYSYNVRVRDATLVSGRGRDGVGINRNVPYPFNLSIEASEIRGFARGGHLPSRGMARWQDCRLANDRNLLVDEIEGEKPQRFQLSDLTFESGEGLVLSLPALDDIRPGALFADDELTLDGRRVFFDAQAPEFVPVPSAAALEKLGGHETIRQWTGESARAIVGKTNRELQQAYGLAVKGAVVPAAAERVPEISGGYLGPAAGTPPETVWLDAENGSLESPWVTAEDEGAAGGTYITARAVSVPDGPPERGYARYEFEGAPGEYIVKGRVRAPAGDRDTFWIRLDGGEWHKWAYIRTFGGWQWHPVPDPENTDQPYRFELSGTSHTLTVAYRESETHLDKLLVTQRDRDPVLFGQPASNES